jgi:hypothetical protein
MHILLNPTTDRIIQYPPVDELLQVYLGQSSGSRAPEPDVRPRVADPQDLWDQLGDFA